MKTLPIDLVLKLQTFMEKYDFHRYDVEEPDNELVFYGCNPSLQTGEIREECFVIREYISGTPTHKDWEDLQDLVDDHLEGE